MHSPPPPLAALVVSGVLVTFAAFLAAVLALYELTRRLSPSLLALAARATPGRQQQQPQQLAQKRPATRRATQQEQQDGERVAYLAALLYIGSPASVFYTTAYSEARFGV